MVMNSGNATEAFNMFEQGILEIKNNYVKIKQRSIVKSDKLTKLSENTLQCMQRRNLGYKIALKVNTEIAWEDYKYLKKASKKKNP